MVGLNNRANVRYLECDEQKKIHKLKHEKKGRIRLVGCAFPIAYSVHYLFAHVRVSTRISFKFVSLMVD